MSNPANETFGQARQGSVAAIIQVLNEQLADVGIRTRAVVADGLLQLLCEAQTADQLEQKTVVSRVRQILENISPQRISKVKINSRIVKEEQLLWLEEINRDPDNAVLWSEIITLKKPFFIKRWIRDRHLKPAGPIFRDISEPDPNEGGLTKKVIGAAGLALLVLATGWLFRDELSKVSQRDQSEDTSSAQAPDQRETDLPPLPISQANGQADNQTDSDDSDNGGNEEAAAGDRTANTTPEVPPPNEPAASSTSSQPTSSQPTSSQPSTDQSSTDQSSTDQSSTEPSSTAATPPPDSSGATADAFAEAVRIANKASTDGQNASTVAEWLDLATRWQRASDLMAQIPEGSEQYAAANERVASYAKNSEMALAQAAALQ